MKAKYRSLLVIILAVLCMSCMFGTGAFAQENTESGQFPDGVIEVSQGTEVSIGEDETTITIKDCPVEIEEGDTFVIYLQTLPIGYVAKSVTEEGDSLVIEAEKADRSIYAMLEGGGEVELTSDMYEFIPGKDVTGGLPPVTDC